MTDPKAEHLNLEDVLGPGSGDAASYVYFRVSGSTATLFVDSKGHAAGESGGTALAQFPVAAGTTPNDLLNALFSGQQFIE